MRKLLLPPPEPELGIYPNNIIHLDYLAGKLVNDLEESIEHITNRLKLLKERVVEDNCKLVDSIQATFMTETFMLDQ